MKSTSLKRAVMALAIVATVACGSGGLDQRTAASEEAAEPTVGPIDKDVVVEKIPVGVIGEWVLTAIDGAPVTQAGKVPTLEVHEDGTAAGVGGVNRFRTEVQFVDNNLSFGPAAATKMAGPPEAMELESTYLARLGAVSTYVIESETLRLWAGDNEALTFKRMED